MKIHEVKSLVYCISDHEWETIEKCLIYCRHRLQKHPESGIQKVTNIKKVDAILKNSHDAEMEIIDAKLDEIFKEELL